MTMDAYDSSVGRPVRGATDRLAALHQAASILSTLEGVSTDGTANEAANAIAKELVDLLGLPVGSTA